MSVTITVSAEVARHLHDLLLDEAQDIDGKLRGLLAAEYRRRLARYRLTDRQFSRKRQMDFASFERQKVTQQQGFTWEVESDAILWETAIDGIRAAQRQLITLTGETGIGDDC